MGGADDLRAIIDKQKTPKEKEAFVKVFDNSKLKVSHLSYNKI